MQNENLICVTFRLLSKPNATQLNATLKKLALELDIVVTCTPPPPHPPHPQTFHPLLDELQSRNLAQTLTRPI